MDEYLGRKQVLDTFIHSQSMADAYKTIALIPAADVVPMSWVREHMSGDYISREQAVENAIDQMRHSKSETAMRERLLNLVAADVRPVIYCKDCRHRDPEDHKCDCGGMERQGCPFKVADDYFCAYGER